jgi:DNA ligase-1
MLVFPALYKPSKTGATQTFEVRAENGIVTIAFGQLGGKMQTKQTVCVGKNLGRSNETTPRQQAELEATSKWEKKQKEGYSLSIEETSEVLLPMKVHTYQEQSHKIVFPCFVSPKLNGVNAEYRLLPEPQVLSRGGERYATVESRDKLIFEQMKQHGIDSINGEIYEHGQHLQDIMSAVKKPSPDKLQPQFYAFDLPLEKTEYKNRRLKMMQSFNFNQVATLEASSHDEIHSFHKKFIAAGYEGTIIRNANGLYEYNTRSYDVLKLKDAQDAEFLIVDYNVDKNGHPVFICEIENGTNFKVKPKGTDTERKNIIANISQYLGNYYTVEFEVYSRDGVPLKPVGVGLRKCDENGNPKE